MRYAILDTGGGRSFSGEDALVAGAKKGLESSDVVIVLGEHAGRHAKSLRKWKDKTAVLIELGTECLGVHTGESRAEEGSNVLGFARFRLGDAEPSSLVELVVQPSTAPGALAVAQEIFAGAGLETALCRDFPGRILDRLLRPFFNAPLRRLDEGLASADDMDLT